MPTPTVRTIGRFEIVRELGKGAQGTVYLAHDPHLQREVAIKSVSNNRRNPERFQQLLREARLVSRLVHPKIVTLYDAIEQDGQHYMVLEYVAGTPLSQMLKREGQLKPARAVDIAIQVLDGLAYAHSQGVIHRDVKPGNVMLDDQGMARLMDFGIASSVNAPDPNATYGGTPLYMAPESADNGPVDAAADIFSLGMVLYEMLAGRPAVSGSNVYEVMHKIANIPFAAPSSLNHEVDTQLDQIVLRAIHKNKAERYPTAAVMKQVLDEYLAPPAAAEPAPGNNQSTLNFLLRRMQHNSNFPALSQTISAINRINADSDESMHALSAVLLKDFALTNRLLRLVNSTSYGQFGGTISTISRAVMILGFNTLRNLAITLVLFDHMQNKALAAHLKEEMVGTFLTGILTRRLAQASGLRDQEESYICGIFHHLGRLLATYYFHEESLEIEKYAQQGEPPEHAQRRVLGVSYEELGVGIAKTWQLPEKIVASMQRIQPDSTRPPKTTTERLRLVTNLAHDLAGAAIDAKSEQRIKAIEEAARPFAKLLGLEKKTALAAVEESVDEFVKEASLIVADSRNSKAAKMLQNWHTAAAAPAAVPNAGAREGTPNTDVNATVDRLASETQAMAMATPQEVAITGSDATAMLTAGIQDITNTLVADFNLNDVLRMILETMFRAMGFHRVLLGTRDVSTNRLVARFGFGPDIEDVLKVFTVPLDGRPNLFQLAMEKNVDLFIADAGADNIRERIPNWHREKVRAQTFLVLPIAINKKAIGLFYADKERAGELTIEPEQLRLLKTLRNQAALTIRQKY